MPIDVDKRLVCVAEKISRELKAKIYAPTGELSVKGAIALLDTGADINCVTKDVVERLGYDIIPYVGQPVGGIAGQVTPLGTVDIFFKVKGGKRMHKEVFTVFDSLSYDMILGIDFMSKYRVIMIDTSLLPIYIDKNQSG